MLPVRLLSFNLKNLTVINQYFVVHSLPQMLSLDINLIISFSYIYHVKYNKLQSSLFITASTMYHV